MSVEVCWLHERVSICVRFYGDVTLDDIRLANEQAAAMMKQTEHGAHVLVDIFEIRTYPLSLMDIRAAVAVRSSEKAGWLVFAVRPETLLHFVASTLARFFARGDRWLVVNHREAARTFVLQ